MKNARTLEYSQVLKEKTKMAEKVKKKKIKCIKINTVRKRDTSLVTKCLSSADKMRTHTHTKKKYLKSPEQVFFKCQTLVKPGHV